MHVGLIGAGRIGALHARSLRSSPLVSRLTIVDADPRRAAAIAAELAAEQLDSPEALFAQGVDAAVIAAPTPAHAALLHMAADASVPAFCEKPVALDLEATEGAMAHVERAGILVQVGFQRRFDAGYRAARQAFLSGALGDVHLVRLATHDPAPPPDAYVAVSGGIWKDLAIHDFDIGSWVLASPITEVFATGRANSAVFERNHDVDAAAATLHFENGAVGALTATRNDARGYDVRMELIGLKDSVVVGWDAHTPLTSVEPGEPAARLGYRDFVERFEEAYRAEIEAFLAAVRDGTPSPCPIADARTALLVAIAAGESMRERRPVRVDEVAVTR